MENVGETYVQNVLMKTSRWRSSPVGCQTLHGTVHTIVGCIVFGAQPERAYFIVNDTILADGKKLGEEKYTGSGTTLQFIPPQVW